MINWNNWSNNKLQIRRVLYYFDYNWPRWPLKFVFLQGWLGPTKIGDLPPAERFSNNLNIQTNASPIYPHRTKNLIFPVASRTFWQTEFTSCQEKHLSFHFLKGKTRTIKIPPSFGCFASPKMHKMHVRCKDANFLCNFFCNFSQQQMVQCLQWRTPLQ